GRVISDVGNPSQAGQDVVNLITQAASGVNNALGQPISTQNGQITGVQAPSIYEAAQSFYKNPIADVLNLDLAGNAAKGAIGKITSGKIAQAATDTTNTLPGGE